MLIQLMQPDFIFDDERGSLRQLVHEGYSQFNIVFSKKGVFRGDHYHREMDFLNLSSQKTELLKIIPLKKEICSLFRHM